MEMIKFTFYLYVKIRERFCVCNCRVKGHGSFGGKKKKIFLTRESRVKKDKRLGSIFRLGVTIPEIRVDFTRTFTTYVSATIRTQFASNLPPTSILNLHTYDSFFPSYRVQA